jgi:ribosomal-protein-serine acetyltransferase
MTERPEPDGVITRGPVTLRRWREDDLDALYRAVIESLDHLRPWMPWAAEYTRQSHTRRGLATAASAALVEQAFRLPGVDRVEIIHDELNVASAGVPRKLGFTEAERRPLDEHPPAGNGVGVVWRLTR